MPYMDQFIDEVRKTAKETSFFGVVSVYKGENVLYHEAFGYADIAEKRENNLDTKFSIASGTKLFTALGIGTLIDSGRLSLDKTVYEIFLRDPSYIDSRATVAQLLSHTSGIYDYYDEEQETDCEDFFVDIPWYRLETPSDYLPLFENKQRKFSPGERFSYSNGGYVFLGIVIEKITGKLYRDYIREKVYDPAGMNDSGFYAFNQLPENTAYGYMKNKDGTLVTNIYNLPIRGGADGGAYTTITDVHKLWRSLVSNRILSERLTDTFLSPHASFDDTIDYGYGIYLTRYQGMDMLMFWGGDPGVEFISRYVPVKELQVTIISNMTNGYKYIKEVINSYLGELVFA